MRFVFNIIFLAILIYSCQENPRPSEAERIRRDFDSINNALGNPSMDPGMAAEYDSLITSLSNNDYGSVRQLYYTINDFYGYMQHLKWQFYTFCGDSLGTALPPGKEADISLTNAFLSDQGNISRQLYNQLEGVTRAMASFEGPRTTKERISVFRAATVERYPSSDQLLGAFCKNIPPVAFITILNSFENNVKEIDREILKAYLNK